MYTDIVLFKLGLLSVAANEVLSFQYIFGYVTFVSQMINKIKYENRIIFN